MGFMPFLYQGTPSILDQKASYVQSSLFESCGGVLLVLFDSKPDGKALAPKLRKARSPPPQSRFG